MIKKFSELAWNVTEPEYREDPAYSYSTLSTFLSLGFNGIKNLNDKKTSSSLTFGSIVDTLLTEGEEAFDKKFFVTELPTISPQLKEVTDTLFNLYNEEYLTMDDIPDTIISSVAADCGYYKDPKYNNTRVKKVRESCTEYYSNLMLAKDKEVISNSVYKDAIDCISTLRNDIMTRNYFAADTPDIEHFYQLKFKGEYEGIPLRCMSDLIIVKHSTKTVALCDLKTSSIEENEFFKAFIKWHYWIQAQLYWYIIRAAMDADPIYKDYKLLDCRFIVINKDTQCPLVWEYPDTTAITDVSYGKNSDIVCKNWRNIVKELHYYLTNNPKYPTYIKSINNIVEQLNNL